MARKARIQSSTGIYYIMLRGLNGMELFHSDDDYSFFQKRLFHLSHPIDDEGEPKEPLCLIYAYCLMTNHVHLMLRTTGKELSAVIKSLAVSYAHYFNTLMTRRGYLFQDRFRSEPVEDFNYLITLFRYIHQNPVKAGLVSDVDNYRWSSWHEFFSSTNNGISICEKSFILDQVGLDYLSTWVKQPLENDDFSSLEDEELPSDNEVRKMLSEMLQGGSSLECLTNLNKNERNELIATALQKGAGIRQLERITGIGFNIIQRLKLKNKSKSPSP